MLVSDETFMDAVDAVSKTIDGVGVVIIVAGLLLATLLMVRAALGAADFDAVFRRYRQQVGKSILLGLEFLVAGDIIRTVAVEPTFRGVGVLALLVAVRTFLSFTLDLEIEGRWPWQRQSHAKATQHDDT